jgi:hypothetical protein
MPEEVLTLVKIPITEIEKSLRAKHILPKALIDFRIDGDALILYFRNEPESRKEGTLVSSYDVVRRKRRAHRKRNRMKTRGWEKVASFVNSKGQPCTIYKPFVDALRDSRLTFEGQKALVARILKSNRNKPSAASVQYFLENTLEYLRNQPIQPKVAPLERESE